MYRYLFKFMVAMAFSVAVLVSWGANKVYLTIDELVECVSRNIEKDPLVLMEVNSVYWDTIEKQKSKLKQDEEHNDAAHENITSDQVMNDVITTIKQNLYSICTCQSAENIHNSDKCDWGEYCFISDLNKDKVGIVNALGHGIWNLANILAGSIHGLIKFSTFEKEIYNPREIIKRYDLCNRLVMLVGESILECCKDQLPDFEESNSEGKKTDNITKDIVNKSQGHKAESKKLELEQDVVTMLRIKNKAIRLDQITVWTRSNDLYTALITLLLGKHKKYPDYKLCKINIDFNAESSQFSELRDEVLENLRLEMKFSEHHKDTRKYDLTWRDITLRLFDCCEILCKKEQDRCKKLEQEIKSQVEGSTEIKELFLQYQKINTKITTIEELRFESGLQAIAKVFAASLLGGETALKLGMHVDRNDRVLKDLYKLYGENTSSAQNFDLIDEIVEKGIGIDIENLDQNLVEQWCISFIKNTLTSYLSTYTKYVYPPPSIVKLSMLRDIYTEEDIDQLVQRLTNNMPTNFTEEDVDKIKLPSQLSSDMESSAGVAENPEANYTQLRNNKKMSRIRVQDSIDACGLLLTMAKLMEAKLMALAQCTNEKARTSFGAFCEKYSPEDVKDKSLKTRVKLVSSISNAFKFIAVALTADASITHSDPVEALIDTAHNLFLIESATFIDYELFDNPML